MFFRYLVLEHFRYGTDFLEYLDELTQGAHKIPNFVFRDDYTGYKYVNRFLLRDGETYLEVSERKTRDINKQGTLELIVITMDKKLIQELIEKFPVIEVGYRAPVLSTNQQ